MADTKSRSEVFSEQRPSLSDTEAQDAAAKGRVIASFHAQPVFSSDGKVMAVSIKWKLGNGETEIIILDRYPADILRMLFERLNENDWTATILVQPNATPQ